MKTILKKIREEKQMSQTEFSKLLGLSQSFYSEIENNTHNPSMVKLQAIADKLNMHWRDLVK